MLELLRRCRWSSGTGASRSVFAAWLGGSAERQLDASSRRYEGNALPAGSEWDRLAACRRISGEPGRARRRVDLQRPDQVLQPARERYVGRSPVCLPLARAASQRLAARGYMPIVPAGIRPTMPGQLGKKAWR